MWIMICHGLKFLTNSIFLPLPAPGTALCEGSTPSAGAHNHHLSIFLAAGSP